MDESQLEVAREMRRESKRDWVALAAPIVISVVLSSGITCIGWVAKSASTDAAVQTQLNEHDRRLKQIEDEQRQYVRLTDQAVRDGYEEEERKEINENLRAMQAKLDQVIRASRR